MSYRISYLMPKKEFERLIEKKQSQAVQEAPAKKSSTPRRNVKPKKISSTPRRKVKPKKVSSAPRRHTKSKTTTSKKAGEDQKGQISRQRKNSREVSEAVRCEE